MYIRLEEPAKTPHLEQENPSDTEVAESECPILDVRNGVSENEITAHIKKFTNWYYQADYCESILDLDLYDDIEKSFFAKLDGVEVDDVEYNRIFTSPGGSGGISDRGITVYMYINDLTDSMGLYIKSNYEENSLLRQLTESRSLTGVVNTIKEILCREKLILESI